MKEAAAQAAESLRCAEAAGAGLEDELRCRDRELRDVAAAKDARCVAAPACPCLLGPGASAGRPAWRGHSSAFSSDISSFLG